MARDEDAYNQPLLDDNPHRLLERVEQTLNGLHTPEEDDKTAKALVEKLRAGTARDFVAILFAAIGVFFAIMLTPLLREVLFGTEGDSDPQLLDKVGLGFLAAVFISQIGWSLNNIIGVWLRFRKHHATSLFMLKYYQECQELRQRVKELENRKR